MHEHGCAELGSRFQHGEDRRIVEIPAVDMRADLDPRQPQLPHAALEFHDGAGLVLHGHGAEPDEPARVGRDQAGNVIVQQLRQVVGVCGPGPVTEHDRNRGEHLHVHLVLVTLGNTQLRVPAVGFDLAEGLAVEQHPGAAGPVMVQLDEAAIAVTLLEIRHRKAFGVGIAVRGIIGRVTLDPG